MLRENSEKQESKVFERMNASITQKLSDLQMRRWGTIYSFTGYIQYGKESLINTKLPKIQGDKSLIDW